MRNARISNGFALTPDTPIGTHGEYIRVHRNARQTMAGACETCGREEVPARGRIRAVRLYAALRHEAPQANIRLDPRSEVAYSVSPADYHALCLPCHRRLDGFTEGGTHCKYDHEYTPENTRIDTDGARRCRTCMRGRKAEKYATKKQAGFTEQPATARTPRIPSPVEAEIRERLRTYSDRRQLGLDEWAITSMARLAFEVLPKPYPPRNLPYKP